MPVGRHTSQKGTSGLEWGASEEQHNYIDHLLSTKQEWYVVVFSNVILRANNDIYVT